MSNVPNIVVPKHPTPDSDLLRSIGTGDLSKTEEAYRKAGLQYTKPPQQIKEEKWYAQVTNQHTGDFLQPETLKLAGLVPDTYENNKKYPIKTLNALIRLRTVDGKEWILSRQMWTGLDRLGNEISKAMEDKEMWLKPVFKYGQRHTNPGDIFSKVESRISSISDFVKEYTLPLNA